MSQLFGVLFSNTSLAESFLPVFSNLFRAELQLPQKVTVMPFPTTAYKYNSFYTITADVRPCSLPPPHPSPCC